MDKQIYTIMNNIISTVIKYASLAAIIMGIVYTKNYSLALGLVFGCVIALINFYIMVYCINNLFNGNVKSKYYYTLFYIARLLVSGLAILYAIKLESLNLVTTIIGLLSITIVITLKTVFKSELII